MPGDSHRRLRLPVTGRTATALAALAAAVFACFPRAFSPHWVFFSRDIHSYWYPMVSTFIRVVAEGSLPLWDPYEGYGLPLWADPGSQVLYPLTWLNLLLFPPTVYKLMVLGHVLGGAVGSFALLRRWGLGRLPSTAAGLVFACSGPVIATGSLVHHLCGAAYIPWVLRALEDVLERGSRRDVAVLALAAGAQALAGSAEMCTMSALAALLRWLTMAGARWGTAIRRLGPLAGAAGVAALLAAVQWLPTLAIVGRTNRARFSPTIKLMCSVHPATLIDAVVPRLMSEMWMGDHVRERLYSTGQPFLMSLYFGVTVLPLVLLSLRSDHPRRRWAWLAFVFFLLLALGGHFAPATAFLSLPPMSFFRYPSKYLVAAMLPWGVLAGLGLDVWWRSWSAADRRLAAVVGTGLLAAAVALAAAAWVIPRHPQWLYDALEMDKAWQQAVVAVAAAKARAAALWLAAAVALLFVRTWRPEWARPTAAAALLLAALDLTSAARPVNPLAPAALLAHRPPLVGPILADAGRSRLLSVSGPEKSLNEDLTRGPAGWEPEWKWTLGLQEMISAPAGSRWGIRGSYDRDFTGIASAGLPLMTAIVTQLDQSPVAVRLLRMGNVGWVIDPRPAAYPLLPKKAEALSVYTRPLTLREVPDTFPPAYVVGGTRRIAADVPALRTIASADFVPEREAIVAGDGADQPAPADWTGSARMLERKANRQRIETNTSGAGLLIVTEAFDRDWRATLDGVPVALERANVLFRGVAVPAGRHVVELHYFPRTVAWGAAATLAGLAIAGGLFRTGRVRRPAGGLGPEPTPS